MDYHRFFGLNKNLYVITLNSHLPVEYFYLVQFVSVLYFFLSETNSLYCNKCPDILKLLTFNIR